ncbi:RDD family protein [Amycolatopsis sp. NPDC026612]|uniref:RDD family protein n=1 Tax=Amycolatopsis sp. NPDC026612 TaxID=3155466 RepID=UPI0033DD8AD4
MTDPYGRQPWPGQAQAPYGPQGNQFGPPRYYANWGRRALAYLIDFAPVIVTYLIAGLSVATERRWEESLVPAAVIVVIVWLGWSIFNRWYLQGKTGQSLGKRVAKIKLVRADTGQPTGFGVAFVRDIAHVVDNVICYLGWLWPLWDEKSQTLADKMAGTVVITLEGAGAAPFGPGAAQPFGHPAPGQQPGQFGPPPSPSGGFPQQQTGGFPQHQTGGFPQQPQQPPQPQSGSFPQQPQQPQPGGFGQPAPGGFGQLPQPGGFTQPPPGGFGQPPAQHPGQQPPQY